MPTKLADSEIYKNPKRGEFDVDNIPLDDPRVWAAFQRADTIGVFQLEAVLGQQWSKLLQPKSIQELSDVISLIRPGPLESRKCRSIC